MSESSNATLSITFSSAFATNFSINIGPPFNDTLVGSSFNDSLLLPVIGKSIVPIV